MVIHAPEEEKVTTVIEMAAKMKDTGRPQAPHRPRSPSPSTPKQESPGDQVEGLTGMGASQVLPPGGEGKLQKVGGWC